MVLLSSRCDQTDSGSVNTSLRHPPYLRTSESSVDKNLLTPAGSSLQVQNWHSLRVRKDTIGGAMRKTKEKAPVTGRQQGLVEDAERPRSLESGWSGNRASASNVTLPAIETDNHVTR